MRECDLFRKRVMIWTCRRTYGQDVVHAWCENIDRCVCGHTRHACDGGYNALTLPLPHTRLYNPASEDACEARGTNSVEQGLSP